MKRGRLILGAASGLEPVRRWPGARLGAPQERLVQCRIWQEASLGEPLQAREEEAAEAEQRYGAYWWGRLRGDGWLWRLDIILKVIIEPFESFLPLKARKDILPYA